MDVIKQFLIKKASEKHGIIIPCSNYSSLNECFTVDDNVLILWFNTEDKSTHIVSKKLN